MKRIISLLLTLIMVMSLCSTVVLAEEAPRTVVTVQGAEGFASQAVTVIVKIDNSSGISGAQLKVKYDKRLELVSATSGGFFEYASNSAIYKQDTAGINGEYSFATVGNGENTAKLKGELLKLTFVLPSDAQEGEKFAVSLDTKGTFLSEGIDSKRDFDIVNGEISVVSATACSTHTFGDEVVVSQAGLMTNGYKYKTCTACSVTEITYAQAEEIDVFDYMGVAVNYTGNPSGIAPMYKVNLEALETLKKDNPDCKVDAGIVALDKKGNVCIKELFYGEGIEYTLKDDVLFTKLNNVSAYDRYVFKAFVKLSNSTTKEERIVYDTATFRGSEEISICDVVKSLDITKYSSKNQVYLEKVLDGSAD